MDYLIVGGWTAGTVAAQELRKLEPASEVTIVDAEPFQYYARPGLIGYLAGRKRRENLFMHPADWYTQQRLQLLTGHRVTNIQPAEHTVTLDNGSTLSYRRMLLATGASPFIPSLPGADQYHVFSLRTLTDADALNSEIVPGATAIIVGGGVLGLETARALCERGMDACVLEFADRLLPNQLDTIAAELLRKRLESMGITIFLKAESQEIQSKKDGAVRIVLKDGRTVQGKFVLFSTGVRPNTSIAREAGLAVGRGVQVDDTMATSAPDIYAAGDVAEHHGRVYGIIPPCLEQARIAARNMVSPGSVRYNGSIMSSSLKIVGVDVASIGIITPPLTAVNLEEICAQDGHAYRKVLLEDGLAKGAVLFGTTTGTQQLQQAIRTGRNLSAFREKLTQIDWDFSGM